MDLVWLLYGRTETKQPTAPALAQEAIALPSEASGSAPAIGQDQEALSVGSRHPEKDCPVEAVSPAEVEALEGRTQKAASASKPICPCGSTRYVDTPIHNGQSLRRNCLQCGRFLGFPVWYEQRQEDLRPDPIPADGIRSLLDRAAALGWPELELSPWDVVGPSEARWRAFARYLARPQPTPSAETTRLRSYQLARLRLAELEARKRPSSLIKTRPPAKEEAHFEAEGPIQ